MSIAISLCALLATFFELYLQRKHNEKSLKPIPQIVLGDKQRELFVHLQNNGVGPLIIQQLSFSCGECRYRNIADCLSFDPKSYNHDAEISKETPKVILPGSHLNVFGMIFEDHESEADINLVRKELAKLRLSAEGRDIYNRRIGTERGFQWFARHLV